MIIISVDVDYDPPDSIRAVTWIPFLNNNAVHHPPLHWWVAPTCPKAPALAARCPGQPPGIGPRWESGAPERNCKIGTWWIKRFSRIPNRTNIREEQKDERLLWPALLGSAFDPSPVPANTFLSPFSLFCSHLKGEAIFSRSMDREMFLKSNL